MPTYADYATQVIQKMLDGTRRLRYSHLKSTVDNPESTPWHEFEFGQTIDQPGSEQGVILQDDEHVLGARITLERLERRAIKFAITCGLYGWFFHTHYCSGEEEARHDFFQMKAELERMADLLSCAGNSEGDIEGELLNTISAFVDRFPT